jgi:CubicO group peptidase (beta-lactamase class C family)
MDFENFCQIHIFRPLNMKSTGHRRYWGEIINEIATPYYNEYGNNILKVADASSHILGMIYNN